MVGTAGHVRSISHRRVTHGVGIWLTSTTGVIDLKLVNGRLLPRKEQRVRVFLRKLFDQREPRRNEWVLPPVLSSPDDHVEVDPPVTRQDLESKFAKRGIIGSVTEINIGPVVTTYDYELDDKVTGRKLDKALPDVARQLGVRSIRNAGARVGSPAISLEVPNNWQHPVDLLGYLPLDGIIPVPLGMDTRGQFGSFDLTIAPHLLVAGASGSGKSVFLNSLITGILAQKNPDEVSFLMIDPKRVELTQYAGIPHLGDEIAVSINDAAQLLRTLTDVMDNRYRRLRSAGVRDIGGISGMPRVVLVVDEFASLISQMPGVDLTVARIAAEGRAAGIHVVIATQHPIVKYVTSAIKANFTTRIAFLVATGTNSRVVLDQKGAEDLLGHGDMLVMAPWLPGELRRYHGPMVSHGDIEDIVNHWRIQA